MARKRKSPSRGRGAARPAAAEAELAAIRARIDALDAELGERIMRSLILRRVRLIEVNLVGPILVGDLTQPGMIRLQGFLTRNGQPHTILDPENDPDAAKMIERLSPDADDYPLAMLPILNFVQKPEGYTVPEHPLLTLEQLGRFNAEGVGVALYAPDNPQSPTLLLPGIGPPTYAV